MATYKGEGQFTQRQGVRVISHEPVNRVSHPEDRGEGAAWGVKAGFSGYDNKNKRPVSLSNASGWAWHDEDKDTGYKAEVHTGPGSGLGKAIASGDTVREAYNSAYNAAENKRISNTNSEKVRKDISSRDERSIKWKKAGHSKASKTIKINTNPVKDSD